MKQRPKKLLSILLALVLALGMLPAFSVTALADGDVTIDLTAQGYTSNQNLNGTSVTQSGATVAFATGSSSNPPVYNSGSGRKEVRCYAKNTITVSSSSTFYSVAFSFASNDGSNTFSVNTGTCDSSTGAWTGSAKSVTFTIGGSNGHRKIKTITVGFTEPHNHNFNYAADGATITATCGATGCDLPDNKATLTIAAPESLAFDNTDKPATLTNTIPGLTDPTVTYTKDGQPFAGTPKEAGVYTASVTVQGQTASVSYTIHAHSFNYYVVDNDTITATCTAGCPSGYDTAPPTLTIAAPALKVEGGSESAAAVLTGAEAFTAATGKSVAVKYKGSGNTTYAESDTAPTAGGTYTASVTVEGQTASVDYAIHGHAFTYAADGATITATCTAGCPSGYDSTPPTLTIVAPTQSGGAAVLSGDTTVLTLPNIQYATRTDGNWGAETTAPPTGKGFHRASITLGGVTASVTYGVSSVTVQSGITGGTVTVPDFAVAGSLVTPTVTPDAGSELDTLTATANGQALTITNGSFTMPEDDVVVGATFKKRDIPVKLTVTGEFNTAKPRTASLLTESFEPAASDGTFTQQVGGRFVLMVNYDDDYDFSIAYTANADTKISVFQKQDYTAYEDYIKNNGGALAAQTYLFWIETPAIAEPDSLDLTVDFQKAQQCTIFYQPPAGTTPETVLCKYQYSKNQSVFDFATEMKNEAGIGDTSIWSVKVKGLVTKVGFVLPGDLPSELTAEGFMAAYNGATMTDVGELKTSVADGNWTGYKDNSKFVVIGGDAKTVVAAFVTDAAHAAVFDSERAGISGKGNGATYQIAVCQFDGNGNVTTPGTVTAPAAPTAPEGYEFGGWRGFEGTAPNLVEKIYAPGASISVRENTTLSAVWNPISSTVTLKPNNGTEDIKTSVTYKEKLVEPDAPEKDGFAFVGWLVDDNVTEDGTLFPKGSLFDFNTGITDDLDLSAEWNHVHSYQYFRMDDPGFKGAFDKYSNYFPYYHVRYCGCSDLSLEAHSYNGNGVCVCGYKTQESTEVTLNVSYGKMNDGQYTEWMREPEAKKSRKQEVTVYAPGYIDSFKFVKWEYSTDGTKWHDLAAAPTVSFIIPCSAQLRALYEETIHKPQIDFKVEWRDDYKTMLYWMDYKLPDGYTYVDAGVRCGDNQSMAYYDMVEKSVAGPSFGEKVMSNINYLEVANGTLSGMVSGGPATALAGFAYNMGMQAGASALETALDDWLSDDEPVYVHVEREDSILNIMSKETLGGYIYRGEAINWDVPTYYWATRPGTQATGKTGSAYVLIPPKYPQRNNGNHWIYGVAFLRYKTPDGQIQTIWTDALAATLNSVDKVKPISKTAS